MISQIVRIKLRRNRKIKWIIQKRNRLSKIRKSFKYNQKMNNTRFSKCILKKYNNTNKYLNRLSFAAVWKRLNNILPIIKVFKNTINTCKSDVGGRTRDYIDLAIEDVVHYIRTGYKHPLVICD